MEVEGEEGSPPRERENPARPKEQSLEDRLGTINPPSFFPLDYFDDQSYEIVDPPALVLEAKSRDDSVTGHSLWHVNELSGGGTEWRPCTIHDYRALDEMYLIRWDCNGKQKWVSRLNVLFEAEDADNFQHRRQVAVETRARSEAQMRYNRTVDAMSTESQLQLPTQQFRRVVHRVGRYLTEGALKSHQPLVEEVLCHYSRTINKLQYDIWHPNSLPEEDKPERLAELIPNPFLDQEGSPIASPSPVMGEHEERYEEDEEELDPEAQELKRWVSLTLPLPVGVKSVVRPGWFYRRVTGITRKLAWGRELMLKALYDMRVHIERVQQMQFLWVGDGPVTVAEFQEKHRTQWESCIKEINLNIVELMADAVLSAYAKDEDRAPDGSMSTEVNGEYSNLVVLANMMMEQAVRQAVMDSVSNYLNRLREYLRPDDERGQDEVLPEDLSLGVGRSALLPLFAISMEPVDGGAEFSPRLEEVMDVSCDILLQLIEATCHIASFNVSMIGATVSKTHLDTVSADEPFVQQTLDEVRACIQDNTFCPRALAQAFDGYDFLMRINVEEHVAAFREDNPPLSAYREQVDRFRKAAREIEVTFPAVARLRMFSVAISDLTVLLAKKSVALSSTLLRELAAEATRQNQETCRAYETIMKRISERPQNPEGLFALQGYAEGVDQELQELMDRTGASQDKLALLDAFGYEIEDSAFAMFWATFSWPKEVLDARQANAPQIEEDRIRFMGELQEMQQNFAKEIAGHEVDIGAFLHYKDETQAEEYAATVNMLEAKLKEASETAALINSREKLFGFPETEFNEITRLQKDFLPYSQLWTMAADLNIAYPDWIFGPFMKLDAESLEKNVEKYWKLCYKLEKTFEMQVAPRSVAQTLKKKLDEFKGHLPLITALRNPGLRDRHWTQLSNEIGVELKADGAGLTLKYILEMDVQSHVAVVTQISEVAAKEYSFERALDKMKVEWDEYSFELQPYRDSGTYVVRGVDEVVALLDDQIVKVQAMRGSPFVKPLEKQVVDWNNQLVNMQEVLDEWLKCQKTWLYLEPIFSSPDIMRQMPAEARRFAAVDKMWRATLDSAAHDPRVMVVMSIEKLKDNFIEANKVLDQVQKGLNDYLETKRQAFPRFYFLSNDELLDILSETKDPKRVVPHLPKAFEAICDVKFEANLDISAMISGEKESVNLCRPVQPDAERNRGSVEKWLIEMEKIMKETIVSELHRATAAYSKNARTRFVIEWAGQVVLAIDCMAWTRDVENALKRGEGRELRKVEKKLHKELEDIVMLVRGDLSDIARLTLGALVVIDVHNRDVVTHMVEERVSNIDDFEWNAQLRYYMEEGGMIINQVSCTVPYGNEYIGNSTRLVITPLTDRCYRTLMGALRLNLGGAPQGPAGTGKTETVKDLSKAVAKQCVVFNCSDGLDYLAMAKFFKGLASCGAWACFDEFNRIELEVLSVIAGQILSIELAIKQKVARLLFEGTEIPIDPSCAIFITMNPGYAGRSELPDNLKALFRPCAMMIPDYAMIAEICLYSYGYTDARTLARKSVYSLRLSSEQLSSQDHYDFGMRAVKSILTAAGRLKREFMDQPEDIICLRAINDVNLPKFVEADIPLFEGITSDLFLGIKVPEPDYAHLIEGLSKAALEMNIQLTDKLQSKCIQLYETVQVRHGLMVVGLTMSMKTVCTNVLANGLGHCSEYPSVISYVINPKAVSYGQLYGMFDPSTREWVEGILAYYVRFASNETGPESKWIIFDGPVDAIWIESMNTVLDDNKKLCLTSGEIIKLSNQMTMMFEPEDLSVASPATVSRCGMVFMEPQMLDWNSLRISWEAGLGEHTHTYRAQIDKLFEHFCDPLLKVLRRKMKEPISTKNSELIASLLRLMDSQLDTFKSEEDSKLLGMADAVKLIDGTFLFSLIWSMGVSTDVAGRDLFDKTVKELAKVPSAPKITTPIPEKGTCYDFFFDTNLRKWVPWLETVPQYSVPANAQFQNIIVPTADTVRYSCLLEILLTHNHHVLLVGPTGTGKSVLAQEKLLGSGGLPEEYLPFFMNFSAQTSANQTQDIIDAKVDKRRKGVFGPPLGRKMIIFVDDLNMPAREVYGAQPPIEILRQWMDHKGWYDRKDISFRQLIDITFVGAMGPPGGGRQFVTARYTRHYNIVSLTPFDDTSLTRIFSTILTWFLNKLPASTLLTLGGPIVKATLDVFATVAVELLPTPAKSHYTFNLRDLAKVIQGILSAPPSKIENADDLLRLWGHECMRIFQDRLIDDTDRGWFSDMLKRVCQQQFSKSWDVVVGEGADGEGLLLYGDFMVKNLEPEKRQYTQLTDMKLVYKTVHDYLDDHNAMTHRPMNLVLFNYVIQHVCSIARVIRQPFGHSLLIGVGGSGRQSTTRLAAAMGDYTLIQIEIGKLYGTTEWREDLKVLFKKAGVEGQRCVFLLTDTQVVLQAQLEDVNNILNTGEVPNLFPSDELAGVMDSVMSKAKDAGCASTPAEVYKFFIDTCRKNMHIVLCMSPVGDDLRNRLRQFPSLVNCTTIDWFTPWPKDGLVAVAAQFLSGIGLADEIREPVIEQCMGFHTSVRTMSLAFHRVLRRHNYVTPTSYLELIATFKSLLGAKAKEVRELKSRYEVGLNKLLDCASKVSTMQTELAALQPVLKQKTTEVESLLVVLDKEKAEAAVMQEKCSVEEAAATVKADEAKEMKESCEAELSQAMPALNAATEALKQLTKGDITEVKSMKNPPRGVKIVMEAVCIMFEVKPDRVDSADGRGKVDDYWKPAQKLLADTRFLQNLFDFDRDNIQAATMAKIKPYVANPEFDPRVIEKVSKAANGLCKWVRAMEIYDKVAKVVEPKKRMLAEAEESLALLMQELEEKQAALREVQDRVADLEARFTGANDEKTNLAHQVDQCEKKLGRAEKLISGLGGERVRWSEQVKDLGVAYNNVSGDVLIGSAVVAYLGVFTGQFRDEAISEWLGSLRERNIPCSSEFFLSSVLGEQVKIREWNISGLPRDAVSVDNAIIMSHSRRWPLLIDPQGQANKWIRNMEKDSTLCVIKLSQSDFARQLENAIQFGTPVLLENVGETLDSLLEPLLLKQVYKSGGQLVINIGDNAVEYSPEFKFYITTKLPNPHYTPEISTKIVLINFTITLSGLEDQLLGITVERERKELEEERQRLVIQNAAFKKQLKDIEDRILEMLSSATGDILEDEELINTLSASKKTSGEISSALQVAEATELKINDTRARYRPVAVRGSLLFFCTADLRQVEPMYQYSLMWFINLFILGINEASHSEDVDVRVAHLISYFTYLLYRNVCRSLFEKDKLLYSFLNTVRIMQSEEKLEPADLRFLLTGGSGLGDTGVAKPCTWMSDKAWSDVCSLAKLKRFNVLPSSIAKQGQAWLDWYNLPEPHKEPLPDGLSETFTLFEKMLVLRCLRMDRVVPAVQLLIVEEMGQRFVEPPPFDLKSAYDDSSVTSPLIFVLSPGADPMTALLTLAESMSMGKKVSSLSLGQGQGPIAEQMMDDAIDRGWWCVLQNCHLAPSWMPTLERKCELISPERAHPQFRLWLTSYPSHQFPVSVLQDGIKMTNEPPKGLRANLLGTYHNLDQSYFDGCNKPDLLRRLHFGLAFFHASIQERRKFGALGWNIMYEFNESDLRVCQQQLSMFINDYEDAPFKALRYTAGETNYGGRVTDDWDRRTLMTSLKVFYCPEALEDGYNYSESGLYTCPDDGDIDDYKTYISSLPLNEQPEVYGLHDNANITFANNETLTLFATFLQLQPRDTGGADGDAGDSFLETTANEILARFPPPFDIDEVRESYPTMYEESMNTVLMQELARFNALTAVVRSSLANLAKAVKGLVVMSADLEALSDSVRNSQIPEMWAAKSYPSLKPLGSYVTDLVARLAFFQLWIDQNAPPVFWISGFYFTQSFLTGTLQNFARRHRCAIDTLRFSFEVMTQDNFSSPPDDGCYINGLFLDGASWDKTTNRMCEQQPKVLFTEVPIIWLKPVAVSEFKLKEGDYECPVYKTSERRGTLSTTGHSTNFVLPIVLPTEKDEQHWVKRGVALLTQLDG